MHDSTEAAITLDDRSVAERVVRQARAYLHTSPYMPLRALSCESDNGVITLKGRVPSFYLKQLALAELMRKLRVREINDLIEVTLPSQAVRLTQAGVKEALKSRRPRRPE